MGHGTAGVDAEELVGNGAGSTVAAADVGSAGTQDGCVSALSPAGTEFQNGTALGSPDDPVGLGRDQALMVDAQQDVGLDQLGLDGRRPDSDDGFSGEHGGSFGYGPDVAGEPEIGQIGQEFLAEDLAAPEIFDIFRVKMQVLHILDDLLQTCGNGESAPVRTLAEEHIKIGDAVLIAVCEIALAHGQLIEIAQHGQIQLVVYNHC